MSLPNIRLEDCTEVEPGLWRPSASVERHVVGSLRMRPGDALIGLSGDDGLRYPLVIADVDGRIYLRMTDTPSSDGAKVSLTVLLALLKADQFEPALRALAELGTAVIVPVICARSIPRIDEQDVLKKTARWRRLMAEATTVSGVSSVPNLRPPIKFGEIEWGELPERRVAAVISDRSLPIGQAARGAGDCVLAVGPEGDWTDEEISVLSREDFIHVSLGPTVLRASTAVTVAASFMLLCAESNFEKITLSSREYLI